MSSRVVSHSPSQRGSWVRRSARLGFALGACVAACADPSEPSPDPDPDPDPPGTCAVGPTTFEHTGGSVGAAVVHKLDPARYPLALCNDGSAGAYILRPGVGAGARRWIVYLEGGGQCGSAEDCAVRYRTRRGDMSSQQLVDGARVTTAFEGFKSTDAAENPDFYDASFVQVVYCSSDLWSGDAAAVSGAPISEMTHWHFRGRAIVDAVLAELGTRGLGEATEVLFAGSSAGAVGVANWVDEVRARLPAATRLLALGDAGFIIEYPPYDSTTQRESEVRPLPQEAELVAATAAWGGRGDQSCEALATTAVERARCRIPSRIFGGGLVSVPVFVRQSQLDAVQTKRLIDPADTSAPAQAFRERFGGRMREELTALGPGFTVHSSHDADHGVMSTTEGWLGLGVDGVALRDAVGQWAREPCPGRQRIAP